jgi:hypothetical protein
MEVLLEFSWLKRRKTALNVHLNSSNLKTKRKDRLSRMNLVSCKCARIMKTSSSASKLMTTDKDFGSSLNLWMVVVSHQLLKKEKVTFQKVYAHTFYIRH